MNNDAAADNKAAEKHRPDNTQVLFLTGLFVVAAVAFILHVTLFYAPLQGEDLERYFQNDMLSQSVVSPISEENSPCAAMPTWIQSILWRLFDGVSALRITAILLHVLVSALLFVLIRIWLARDDKIGIPLLGGLLMAVVPAGAVTMSQSEGWAVLLACSFALAGGVLFLSGTADPAGTDYLRVLSAAWCAAAAVASHPAMVLAPLFYLALDLLRVGNEPRSKGAFDWKPRGIVFAAGLLALIVLHYNDSMISFASPYLLYALFAAAILILCRGVDAIPVPVVKRVFCGLLALLLLIGAAFSFMQVLRRADPETGLARHISTQGDAPYRRQLALQYLDKAFREKDKKEQQALFAEAASLWPQEEEVATCQVWERLLLAEILMKLDKGAAAATMIAPLLDQVPFETAGRRAARLKAGALGTAGETAVDKSDASTEIAALYSFATKYETLSAEENLLYARSLSDLGDMTGAANLFASLPEYPKDSPEGIAQRQALTAADNATNFRDDYRKKVMEDPHSAAGYVALARSCFLEGNLLRAFYWLEMTLRREPNTEGAWELLGTLLALRNQSAYFISQWGPLKADMPQAWLLLARSAAAASSWEAAYEYAKHAAGKSGLSPEEFMAAFAVESGQLDRAEQWLARAVEMYPLAYSPRLLKADLAIAGNRPDDARRFLDEARLMQAPEAEITQRLERLKQSSVDKTTSPGPFKPVRTYIQ